MDRKDEESSLGFREERTYMAPSPLNKISHPARPNKPLIDYVSNKWQNEKSDNSYYPSQEDDTVKCCDFDEESSCPTTTRNLLTSRRYRRMFSALFLISLALYQVWSQYIQPHLQEERMLAEGFLEQRNGTYGLARGGDSHDMVRIQTLDASLVPGGDADPEGKRRLIFIGDVHGCRKELLKLIRKVDFDPTTDHLILTGDVISKGPDSLGVLEELFRLNATTVRGNHEDRVLTAAHMVLDSELPPSSASATSRIASDDGVLLRNLKPHHLEFLRQTPLMLRIPALPLAAIDSNSLVAEKRSLFSSPSTSSSHHHKKPPHSFPPISSEIVVVHAGLVPGVPLMKQDPYFVLNMRSIHHRTHVPSTEHVDQGSNRRKKKGAMWPWPRLWEWYNQALFEGRPAKGFGTSSSAQVADGGFAGMERKRNEKGDQEGAAWWRRVWDQVSFGTARRGKARPEPMVVVYGHNSRLGLQLERWSKGLDSACVTGGRLTALVLDARGRQEVQSVGCKEWA